MTSKGAIARVVFAVAAAFLPMSASAQIAGMALDQANDNFGFYFNHVSFAWQSFTAGTNGHLRALQAHIYSTDGADWSATLEIREGSGTSGTLLTSQVIVGDGVKQQCTFVMEKPVRQTSGDVYSFVVRNASTGLTVRASADLYLGGRSHNNSYDYNFKTWVLASDWSEQSWRDTNFTADSTVIATAEQLAQFAWLVNNGTTFAGKTLALAADIDLGAHYWTPAGGDSARFNGVFKGAGRSISGLFIENPGVPYQGLFGVIDINASVEDLVLAHGDIRGGDYSGVVVGRAYGEVWRCRAAGVIAGGSMVGGVAGCTEGILEGCANAASVSGASAVGGVAGLARGGAGDCSNSGAVSGANDVGGVVGFANGDLRRCANSGAVAAHEGERTGGVAGSCSNVSLSECTNSGDVGGPATVGGIVGDPGLGLIDRCVNSGTVGGAWVGGIAAITGGTIRNCVNRGAVALTTPDGVVGGIAGENNSGVVVNCANEGAVSGSGESCFAGGLVGWNWGGEIRNGANSGAVTGTGGGDLGGIVGRNDGGGAVAGCFWKRTGTAPFDLDGVGYNAFGGVDDCQPFGAAPGTLGATVTVDGLATDSLAEALNAWMAMTRDDDGAPLRRWTPGSASAYPTLVESRWSDEGNFATNWYDAAGTDFVIGTPAELAGLAALVNGGTTFENRRVTLGADLAMEGREWTPIGALDEEGTTVSSFGGIFDGNGKTVSGVYVDRYSSFGTAGLFGAAQAAIIANLTVADADIAASDYAGALCGIQDASWILNCSSGGRVSGGEAAGGISGRVAGVIVNCWSGARVDGSAAGGVAGLSLGDQGVGRCYWKRTGTAPFDLSAVGEGDDVACYAFAGPPGALAEPPDEFPPTLAGALNDLVRSSGAVNGIDLYGWTSGATNRYPVLTPLIRVGGETVEEALSDGFCSGMTYAQVDAAVAAYANACPEVTAATFGALMSQADALGFTFAELAEDEALLDFKPSLVITAFDPASRSLTFRVGNGIDATPQASMNRLAASSVRRLVVQQMEAPDGEAADLQLEAEFSPDGSAHVTFMPVNESERGFFKIRVDRTIP